MSSLPTAELAADPRVAAGFEAQLELRGRRLEAGERPLGWKLGFGAAAARQELGTAAPLVGFLTDRSLIAPPDRCAVGTWARPLLEPEIAARIGRPLAPGGTIDEASRSVEGFAPAFELADLDPPPTDVERILAGNIFHRGLVLGPFADATRTPVAELRAEIEDEGAVEAVERPEQATGPVVALVRHVADLLGHFGLELGAGEILICGSIVPPIAVAPGRRIAYRLHPIAELSIELTD